MDVCAGLTNYYIPSTSGLQEKKSKRLTNYKRWCTKAKRYNNSSRTTDWIEKLLWTPITGHRKFASHWILSRYLINVKHITANDAYTTLKDWSIRCNEVETLSPSAREFDIRIRYDIKEAVKNRKVPIGKNLLREMNKELYQTCFWCVYASMIEMRIEHE